MSHSDFREELQYYKEHIDIRDYLEASGYEIDKSRDTARYRAYTHPDTRDKVYIPKNSQHKVPNYYVNQLDNDDKGTLLDFIMSREQKSLDEARLSLRAFHQGYVPSPPPPVEKVNDQKKEKQKYVIQKIVEEHPSGLESPYLKERWLSDETLRHPAFRDKVKLNSYAAEQYLAFPLADHEGKVSGVALKSVNKERILGEKSGVWSSHPSNGKLTIDRMVITEHPIDAMSYHQLFDDKQRNTIYLSTAGNPSNKQIEVIQNHIHLHKPKEIILANDLDKAGQLFNQKYLEKLKPHEAVLHEEKPQFKDWNADLSAWSLYKDDLAP